MTKATPGTTSSDRSKPDIALKRAINGKLLYLFILGDVLGAGIYALSGQMKAQAGGTVWLPLALAVNLALLAAASYVERVTKYPRAGGAAVFAPVGGEVATQGTNRQGCRHRCRSKACHQSAAATSSD